MPRFTVDACSGGGGRDYGSLHRGNGLVATAAMMTPTLINADLRRRLLDLRHALIEQLEHDPIEPGLLSLLANTQSCLIALDCAAVAAGPKERCRE